VGICEYTAWYSDVSMNARMLARTLVYIRRRERAVVGAYIIYILFIGIGAYIIYILFIGIGAYIIYILFIGIGA